MPSYRYQPYYCEENIWHLAQQFPNGLVAFILNQQKFTKLYYQKAAGNPLYPIYWDYHVILLHEERQQLWVYDFDTYLDFPTKAKTYFEATFHLHTEPADPHCVLRLIEAKDYLQHFSSDRSHMKDQAGNWLQSPPNWEPILNKQADYLMPLQQILNLTAQDIGQLIPLPKWLQTYA